MDKSITIKENLHSLINKIDNNELLEMVYQVLNSKQSYKEGELISTLTAEEKAELYQSYDESLNESNLTDLKDIKKKHSRWLKE